MLYCSLPLVGPVTSAPLHVAFPLRDKLVVCLGSPFLLGSSFICLALLHIAAPVITNSNSHGPMASKPGGPLSQQQHPVAQQRHSLHRQGSSSSSSSYVDGMPPHNGHHHHQPSSPQSAGAGAQRRLSYFPTASTNSLHRWAHFISLCPTLHSPTLVSPTSLCPTWLHFVLHCWGHPYRVTRAAVTPF